MKSNINSILDLIDKCETITLHIINSDIDLEAALNRLDNRGRLINIIQHRINHMLDQEAQGKVIIPEQSRTAIQHKFSKIYLHDDNLIKKLELMKNSLKKKIAKSYKNKENFKGYNPKQVR